MAVEGSGCVINQDAESYARMRLQDTNASTWFVSDKYGVVSSGCVGNRRTHGGARGRKKCKPVELRDGKSSND